MKNFTRIISISLILFVGFSSLNAQPWLQSPYLDRSNPDLNFYDIKNAFDQWAEGKDLSKEKGIKRYKRWEWFYGPRVSPTGEFPDPAINWKEWQKEKLKANKTTKDAASWYSLAPNDVPLSLDETSIHGMGRINCIEFHPTDTNTLYVGASQGGVWKSTDDGDTWVCLTDELPVLRVSSIAVDPNNPNTIYIATGDIDYVAFPTVAYGRMSQYGVGVLKTTDGGATWNTTGLSFLLTDYDNSLIRKVVVNKSNSDIVLAVGPSGSWLSTDAGVTWDNQTSDEMFIDLEVNPLRDSTLYAATFYNTYHSSSKRIYKSLDFGTTWTELDPGIPAATSLSRIEIALSPSDTSVLYALTVKGNGGMYSVTKTIDAGATWNIVADDDDPNMLGWADGGIYTGAMGMDDDSGQGDYDLTLIVNPYNPEIVYSGGVNMWGSEDGGVTWDIVSMWMKIFGASVHADQHCSAYNPLNGHFYQGCDGGIFKTTDLQIGKFQNAMACVIFPPPPDAQGIDDIIIPNCYFLPTTWEDITGGIHNTEYYRFGSCKTNPEIIVGGTQDNGTYKYDNGTWINTYGGDGMEAMVDHFNSDIYYVTNYNGALSKTVDGGVTFTTGHDTTMTSQAGEAGDWVTPFVMHPTSSDTIYAAFQNVWRSSDSAMTWEKISPFTLSGAPFKALAVAPSNSNYIYVSTANVIYMTNDGGANWNSIASGLSNNTITYIAVHERDPETVWISMSGYNDGQKVYKSTDAGSTWENISYNLPNVSANCLAFQDSTSSIPVSGVYVGTDIGVYYMNRYTLQDASQEWVTFTNGLPSVIVNELELHYGAGKLRAATYGRGIWETNMWDDVPQVLADFTSDSTSIHVGSSVNFTDLSTNYPEVWSWNFEGASTLTSVDQAPVNIAYPDSGSYDVQLIVSNGATTDTINKADYIIVGGGSSIGEIEMNGGLRIFPNPNNGYVIIEGEFDQGEQITINLFNVTGEKIRTYNDVSAGYYNKKLDLKSLESGNYIIQLNYKGTHYTGKLIRK